MPPATPLPRPEPVNDWDPRDPVVLADPIASYDALRRRCPVAHSDSLHHSVLRHGEVMRVLGDPATYSSQASSHVSVPNSMDPPEHGAWRALIDPYFSPTQVKAFAPRCRHIGEQLVNVLPKRGSCELMTALAQPFAVRAQCAFMGWPEAVHAPLLAWIDKKNAATLAGDKQAIAAVATEFDSTIRALLQTRRDAGPDAPPDTTTRLLRETIHGRPVTETEIVSILRNWTVGELGTIAASIGIIVDYLATHSELQDALREHPEQLWQANDEILRIHAPLAANRRTPTCPVHLGGRDIQAGERLTLMWASANRDEAVFGDPDTYDPRRNASHNLLYGAGIHACPGAPLARLELVIVLQALLRRTRAITPDPATPPLRAIHPASGYRQLHVRLQ